MVIGFNRELERIMAKKPTQSINSPKGELRWIFITGEGKEDLNGNPRYSASIYFKKDDPALKAFQKEVEAFWEANKPKTAKKAKSIGIYLELEEKDSGKITISSITQPYDKDDYSETGFVCINAWTGIANQDGSKKRVKTYNAKGSEVSLGSKTIGNGSIGRLGLVMGIYENGPNVGVTLYLSGVQLTKFVEYSAGASFAADDDDEDGFSGIEEDFDSISDTADDSADSEAPAKAKASVRL